MNDALDVVRRWKERPRAGDSRNFGNVVDLDGYKICVG
jgi:hypothetical protein